MKSLSIKDIISGLSVSLLIIPSSIAYSLIIYGPLGKEFESFATLSGIISGIILCMLTSIIGGSKFLITIPCAPAAAVLSVFTSRLVLDGSISIYSIPFYISIVSLIAGFFQLIFGLIGGGKIIKYLPYQVITGYMSGIGLLIIINQLPIVFGFKNFNELLNNILYPLKWNTYSLMIGLITIIIMIIFLRSKRYFYAIMISLLSGILIYLLLSIILKDENKKQDLVISFLKTKPVDIYEHIRIIWDNSINFNLKIVYDNMILIITLFLLLSADTLKTCVILDMSSNDRYNANKVLFGQGLGNIFSSIFGGIPGAGNSGISIVNFESGAKTSLSGIYASLFSVAIFLIFGSFISLIPIASLAGILIVIGFRMIDFKAIGLLRYKATIFDFLVILAVIIASITKDLLAAAIVGLTMSVLLFLREQIRFSVIYRKSTGKQFISKKNRQNYELKFLEKEGDKITIFELQGQLFFGTADQLNDEIEEYIDKSKYIILDMKRVISLDFTAANILKQISKRFYEKGGILILSSVPSKDINKQNVMEYLKELGVSSDEKIRFFNDLENALSWCEDRLLYKNFKTQNLNILKLKEFILFEKFEKHYFNMIEDIVSLNFFKKNSYIYKKGNESTEIYFLASGSVRIIIPYSENKEKFSYINIIKGGVFGISSFINDNDIRRYDALADEDSYIYILDKKLFMSLINNYPEIEGIFYKNLTNILANKLVLNRGYTEDIEIY